MNFVRFKNDENDTVGTWQWTLEWPPPNELWVTPMPGSGGAMIGDTIDNSGDNPSLFHRVSYSELTDDEAKHPNLARGALYVTDPQAWDGQS